MSNILWPIIQSRTPSLPKTPPPIDIIQSYMTHQSLPDLIHTMQFINGQDHIEEEVIDIASIKKEIDEQVYGYKEDRVVIKELMWAIEDGVTGVNEDLLWRVKGVDEVLGEPIGVEEGFRGVFGGKGYEVGAGLLRGKRRVEEVFGWIDDVFTGRSFEDVFVDLPVQNSVFRHLGGDSVQPSQGMSFTMEDYILDQYNDSILAIKHRSINQLRDIAAFDMDETLIQTESGRAFPTGRDDWKFINDHVPQRLKDLNRTHDIVIFSNQLGISKGRVNPKEILGKIVDISERIGIPLVAVLATKADFNRKPNTGMWDYLTHFIPFIGTKENSFFVGDAAGRFRNARTGKKDFSCSDRKFAANIGLPFQTENMFFSLMEEDFEWGTANPRDYLGHNHPVGQLHSDHQEMVILIGPPASGKSTLSKKHFIPNGYTHINRDTLLTKQKCLENTQAALQSGVSVVIDNTNPTREARGEYIKLAQEFGIPVRCFTMTTNRELSQHLNVVRERMGSRRVPEIGYNMYYKKFQPPHVSEGFTEVRALPFSIEFESEFHRTAFLQWS